MKVSHIYHSGFYFELSECALLFDYYRGALPKADESKPLYIFASHVHPDHFSFAIFENETLRAHQGVRYILSNDIKRKYNRNFFLRKGVTEEQYGRIIFMKTDEELSVGVETESSGGAVFGALGETSGGAASGTLGETSGGAVSGAVGEASGQIRVRTLKSTDAGVAFLVGAGGRLIYHAGDLNWWSWEGGPDEDERRMEQDYKREIAKLDGLTLDAACLPFDPRQGERAYLGFDWFMRHVKVRRAYPMHYLDGQGVLEKLCSLPCSGPYRDKIAREQTETL